MLHLTKNNVVTGVARQQVEIRQSELDWYCDNYSAMTGQAAMLAGFAFSQLQTELPTDKHKPALELCFGYLFLTCMTIGLELSAIILSTALSVWGPSLALRGKGGTADLHKAVDALRAYQSVVFFYFIVGWIMYFFSAILQIWIYTAREVALVVTIPMSGFVLGILWYTLDIIRELRVEDHEAVSGKIEALQPYEFVGDIDHGLHDDENSDEMDHDDGVGFCPINAEHEGLPEHLRSGAVRGDSQLGHRWSGALRGDSQLGHR